MAMETSTYAWCEGSKPGMLNSHAMVKRLSGPDITIPI
jgi:hypothetical protein